jgi:hypothetical protein
VFDFRYHALSLVAVFLALAIGVLLGVAIGDRGLASSAEHDVRASLSDNVRSAQGRANQLNEKLSLHKRFEEQAFPTLVAGRLDGRSVAVVGLGGGDDAVTSAVRDAVRAAGGEIASVSVIREPLELSKLAQRVTSPRFALLEDGSSDVVRSFARRLGVQMVRGGRMLRRVRPTLFRPFSGRLTRVDAVVLVRQPVTNAHGNPLGGSAGAAVTAFEDGFVRGLTGEDIPVVGAQTTDTDPSQVDWFQAHDVASVDDVDLVLGKAALVFAAADPVNGAYGTRPDDDALLPRIDPGLTSRGSSAMAREP